jgi:hypothetical protein
MTIEEQWRALESESVGAEGWRLRLARPVKGYPLFVACEGASARRALLLRVPADSIPPKRQWPVIAGVEVTALTLAGHVSFGVVLRDPRFTDVFSALAEDLARRVEESSGAPAEAVALLLGQLVRWQRFLAASTAGLSPEAQRGLWGELKFLHDTLIPITEGGVAVLGWKGPVGAHQDFQYTSAWIEVKTTLAKQPQTVRIASERQLDDTHAPALFLHVLMLETHEGGPATLPALVAQLRAMLEPWPATREVFEDALLAARYLDSHAPRYVATGYAVRQADTFRVGAGFPRIIEANLPSGIGDANYQLSLAACTAFSAPISAITDALQPSPPAS